MASSDISIALAALLPSYSEATNRPPATLVSLATSLLSLSRSRAPHLKPEEEIARPHACAEIACRRLRVKLRLAPLKSGGAPCKPAVYKKLLTYLEGALPEPETASHKTSKSTHPLNDTTPKPPSRKRTAAGEIKDVDPGTSSLPIPSSSACHGKFVGRVRNDLLPSTTLKEEAPVSTMPLIRRLCKTFANPTLIVPHVYTGTCVVLRLSGLWPPTSERDGNDTSSILSNFEKELRALIVALYFMVLARMQRGPITTETYVRLVELAVDVAELRSGESRLEGKREVENWIKKLNKEGWCSDEDWWQTVPENSFDCAEARISNNGGWAVIEDEEDIPGDRGRKEVRREAVGGTSAVRTVEEDCNGILMPGLGTMMQAAVDWVSLERKMDFRDWRQTLFSH